MMKNIKMTEEQFKALAIIIRDIQQLYGIEDEPLLPELEQLFPLEEE